MQTRLGCAARAWARACACALGLSAIACGGDGGSVDGQGNDGSGAAASADMDGAQGPAASAGTPGSAGNSVPVSGVVDAGPALPPPLPACDQAPTPADAGVSPYDGTCVDESVGVFASPSGGVAPRADGSRSRPLRSLQDAVGLAVRTGRDVYACVGTYDGALQIGSELSDGLKLYGGLSCDGFGEPDASGARSVVRAREGTPALRIDGCHGVTVERFELHADRAEMPKAGTSYIAASVTNARGVELRDVVLRAADGEPGADGEVAVEAAASGAEGGDGQDACARNPNLGGAGAQQTQCGVAQPWISGGAGGLGGVGTGDGGSGFQQTFPATLGEPASGSWSCTQGSGSGPPPSEGGVGTLGRGGRGFGALLGGRFVAYGGQFGGDGPPGSGGTGGGGARAPASCAGLGSAVGASGGGGGSGGCGGKGGAGGGAGGSSIALLALDAEVALIGGELHVGRGGAGGDGAVGQAGGKGGKGGQGGQGVSSSSDACDGTDGSEGSEGGPGGGGNGGHAIGVLYDGDMPVLESVNAAIETATDLGGAPGAGPEGTEALEEMLRGTPGVTAHVREF